MPPLPPSPTPAPGAAPKCQYSGRGAWLWAQMDLFYVYAPFSSPASQGGGRIKHTLWSPLANDVRIQDWQINKHTTKFAKKGYFVTLFVDWKRIGCAPFSHIFPLFLFLTFCYGRREALSSVLTSFFHRGVTLDPEFARPDSPHNATPNLFPKSLKAAQQKKDTKKKDRKPSLWFAFAHPNLFLGKTFPSQNPVGYCGMESTLKGAANMFIVQ